MTRGVIGSTDRQISTVAGQTKAPGPYDPGALGNYPGNDLLSHAVTHAVPSALEGLTSVFGMGTGVTPAV